MTNWLVRELHSLSVYYRLCLTEGEFLKELKRLKFPQRDWISTEQADATVHHITTRYGKHVCIVCIRSTKGCTMPEICGLLVHEAVHIWQRHLALIGEDEPSSEFEAYAIQSISQRLIDSYLAQTKKKRPPKKTGTKTRRTRPKRA